MLTENSSKLMQYIPKYFGKSSDLGKLHKHHDMPMIGVKRANYNFEQTEGLMG